MNLKREYALQMPTNYVEIDRDEMEYVDGGGFVGFRVHISDRVLNIGAIVGAAIIGGYVGWYAKALATTPWGAGAAVAIVAAAAGVTGWAIRNGMKVFDIGTSVLYVSWTQHIYIS